MRKLILTSPELLEALAVFATHTLRMRDSRSCAVVCRLLRDLVPEFQTDETAALIREFFSTEVLRACITSIHEPYFAETQKELAGLVAAIIVHYSPKTGTPRLVMMSLPNMSEGTVSRHFDALMKATGERQQRSQVLALLDGVRGISIHEQGKIRKPARRSRTRMDEQFTTVNAGGANGDVPVDPVDGRQSPDLAGVAQLFG